MQPRDLDRTMRRLEPGGWLAAARRFGSSLRSAGHEPGRLLVVGTPEEEPWHLTAHLDQAARFGGVESLKPTLVRWHVPEGAPAHLAVDISAVNQAARGATVFVATPAVADEHLLERLDDARRGGAALFALHPGEDQLDSLVHESLNLPTIGGMDVLEGWETATHVVSAVSASEPRRRRSLWRPRTSQAG